MHKARLATYLRTRNRKAGGPILKQYPSFVYLSYGRLFFGCKCLELYSNTRKEDGIVRVRKIVMRWPFVVSQNFNTLR